MVEGETVEITRLGSQGDGVTETGSGPAFVPFALPGERWRLGAGAPQRLSDSTARKAPLCRHFGVCGGCVAQHMSDGLYASWKRGIVIEAFRHRGIDAVVEEMVRVSAHSRRRAFLGVIVTSTGVRIGFREEGEHTLVDMQECPVLDDRIVSAIPHLKEIARVAMPAEEPGRLVVTRLDRGLDIAFDNGLKSLMPDQRSRLAAMAERAGLIRLTIAGDVVVEFGLPHLSMGGVAVSPPPSIFLQAVPEAEQKLVGLVMGALPRKAKIVADLFSGIGTFTFPLASRVKIQAFDSDKRAIGALMAAARHATGLKPIEAKVRDLFREPLSVRELDTFDVIVFDPPRAGAAEQAERIARSKVPIVIAVSCNPATLARDARTLIDGGYTMGPVTPVDQFLYSPHIEALCVFRR